MFFGNFWSEEDSMLILRGFGSRFDKLVSKFYFKFKEMADFVPLWFPVFKGTNFKFFILGRLKLLLE